MSNEHHHHHHSHSGGHHHHHSHGAVIGRMRFAFVLNLGFALVELVGGYLTNSVAIMSDALHDFGDALAMIIAIVMEKVSHKSSDQKFSYGYRRFSVLGAVITGMVLIIGSVFILVEAVPRLLNPQPVHANGMLVLAVMGVAINGFAALRVSKGTSLNERMLMWHMIEDVLGWVLVLFGALVMKFWDIPQVDAGLAVALSLWILFNVFKNLREAMKVFLMASPTGASAEVVSEEIKKIPMVVDVHHSHLWSLDGENHVYTAHVVLKSEANTSDMQNVKNEIKKRVKNFGIVEATIETELTGVSCLDPQHS
ncbi:cation diffusion facilitator family transporter [Bdellovibrio sp. SKB1291214]|uniref:cation diffusion facilitator family transporter n=1 Tax=Bdellovibrio sp. SKB1291214 TaxID=1732569 RepID=UPI000B51B94B|nr:cation diffusion facilitator family transporter [Bdellovibrio sp. SKB1291214]UYL08334.1 cation diffusion facilitator family transporter [Bdellovibrio sp. SKB1291214]